MDWKDRLVTFDDLVSLLGNTQLFFAERLHEADTISRSVQVFILGALISMPLVSGFGQKVGVTSPPIEQLIVSSLIYALLLAVSVAVAWRFFGIKHNLRAAVSAMFYFFSVLTPLAILLFGSFIVSMQKTTSLNIALVYVSSGLLMYWTFRVWRAFASLKPHSCFQTFGAAVVFLALALISSEIISNISTVMG